MGLSPKDGGQGETVTVRMFDFDYEIKSDTPDVVRLLAADIDREAREIQAATPGLDRGQFNWPVQVAFKMALGRYSALKDLEACRAELEALKERVESEAGRLARRLDEALGS